MKTIKSESILYLCYNFPYMPNIWIFNSWQIIQKKKTTEKKAIAMLFSEEEDVFTIERDGSVTVSTKSRKVTVQVGSKG